MVTMKDILKVLKVEPANNYARTRLNKIAKNKTLVIKLYEEDDNWKRDVYEASGISPDGNGATAIWTRQMDNRVLVVTISKVGSRIYEGYLDYGFVDVKSVLKVTC